MQTQLFTRLSIAAWLFAAGTFTILITGCPSGPVDPPPGQGDSDADGVINADDDCPNTPEDATVDPNGCALSQRDTDEDGVNDDVDTCPGTSMGTPVDANGCPVPIGDDDTDDDGVVNDDDDCPNTPPDTEVDANGCPLAPDADGDGVADADDDCANTPAGTVVDANGCPIANDEDGDGVMDADDDCPDTELGTDVDANGCPIDTGDDDSDGDGVPNNRDDCEGTPAGTDVDENGCPESGGGDPVCGNNVVEAGEECEPPNSTTCDSNCDAIIRITANACDGAQALSEEGTVVFDNSNATLDGPGHTDCVSFGSDQVDHDVWACWESPCTGTVFVRTCGLTAVDTKLAVYDGCDCPATDARLLSCNDDACTSSAVQSLVTFEAVSGQSYLIRIGTFSGEPGGVGGVNISCSLPTCGAAGDCLAAHDTAGCGDANCCEETCAIDPYCCDTEWDEVCAEQAQGLCTGNFAACQSGLPACTRGTVCSAGSNEGRPCAADNQCPGGGEGSCRSQPGCGDVDCCNNVCAEDPYCCLQEWDNVCAEREASRCHSACGPDAGDPLTVHDTPGSNDEACCGEVCTRDPACCQEEWDQPCVDLAEEHCE